MLGFGSDADRTLELVTLPSATRPLDTRSVRRFHPSWLYCRVHNCSDQSIFVYGPRHPSDDTKLPTSLFVLSAGTSTPKRWDCKGILIPIDRTVAQGSTVVCGPVALKYRDMRRIRVTEGRGQYRCPLSNGILKADQIDCTVPLVPYEALLDLPRRLVTI